MEKCEIGQCTVVNGIDQTPRPATHPRDRVIEQFHVPVGRR